MGITVGFASRIAATVRERTVKIMQAPDDPQSRELSWYVVPDEQGDDDLQFWPLSTTLTWNQRGKLIGPLPVVIEMRPNLLIRRVLEQLVGGERPITISADSVDPADE